MKISHSQVQKVYKMKNAVLFLNKPKYLSSQQAVSKIKRLYHTKKAGHSGTLDPLATGMLQIFLNQATKFSQYLIEADKKYRVTAKLGITTTTGDSEGKIIAENFVPPLNQNSVENVLKHFVGEQWQVPPMYSALKYQGKPLYEYAREGTEIPREPRQIQIYSIQLIQFHPAKIEFEVHCSKGTYIRSLVIDIGEKFGCGAHVSQLHRLAIGRFGPEWMHDLDHIENHPKRENLLIPVDKILPETWPEIYLTDRETFHFKRGQAIDSNIMNVNSPIKIYSHSDGFIGLGKLTCEKKIQPVRLVV